MVLPQQPHHERSHRVTWFLHGLTTAFHSFVVCCKKKMRLMTNCCAIQIPPVCTPAGKNYGTKHNENNIAWKTTREHRKQRRFRDLLTPKIHGSFMKQ